MEWCSWWVEKPSAEGGLVFVTAQAEGDNGHDVSKSATKSKMPEIDNVSMSPIIDLETWSLENFRSPKRKTADASNEGSRPKDTNSLTVIENDNGTISPHPVSEVILSVSEAEQVENKNDTPRTSSDHKSSDSSSQRSRLIAKAAPSKERGNSTEFVLGQNVKAQYFNGYWYPAKISEVKGDGIFYVVDWEDDDPVDRLKCSDEV
jgi:hypothetical protein